MIRRLAIVAGAGFLTMIACGAAVVALGGPEIVRDGFIVPAVLERIEQGDDYDHPDTPQTEKTAAWTGSNELTLDLAADVTVRQGTEAGIVISGSQKLVDRVRIEGGRIFFADEARHGRHVSWGHNRHRLRITVTAPAIRKVTINGSADVDLVGYDQPDLTIDIRGSADVDGSGKTGDLTVDIRGSADVDLRSLPARSANVSVAGSGDVEIDATEEATVRVSGSGDVSLVNRPPKLDYSVSGSGDVMAGGVDLGDRDN